MGNATVRRQVARISGFPGVQLITELQQRHPYSSWILWDQKMGSPTDSRDPRSAAVRGIFSSIRCITPSHRRWQPHLAQAALVI